MLTGQNNKFELEGNREENLMGGNVKCLRLQTEDKKNLMLGNFFLIINYYYFSYDFTDIDECKGNHSCHMNATCTNTIGSHVCDCHPGYSGNGQSCTGTWCVSSVTIPMREKSCIIFARLVLLALPLYKKRDEYRPEDNGDNDNIVLNEHLVVKNLSWQRETWWI